MQFTVKVPIFKTDVYNIKDYGAKEGLFYNNRTAIQSAIDTDRKSVV